MPEKRTLQRARRDKAQGKAPSTQAGEFIREEMEHIREGKHGARSARQAIAIGLSKARRAGVDLPPPEKGMVSEKTRRSAARAYARGHGAAPRRKSTAKRSRATFQALKREGRSAASRSRWVKRSGLASGTSTTPGLRCSRLNAASTSSGGTSGRSSRIAARLTQPPRSPT